MKKRKIGGDKTLELLKNRALVKRFVKPVIPESEYWKTVDNAGGEFPKFYYDELHKGNLNLSEIKVLKYIWDGCYLIHNFKSNVLGSRDWPRMRLQEKKTAAAMCKLSFPTFNTALDSLWLMGYITSSENPNSDDMDATCKTTLDFSNQIGISTNFLNLRIHQWSPEEDTDQERLMTILYGQKRGEPIMERSKMIANHYPDNLLELIKGLYDKIDELQDKINNKPSTYTYVEFTKKGKKIRMPIKTVERKPIVLGKQVEPILMVKPLPKIKGNKFKHIITVNTKPVVNVPRFPIIAGLKKGEIKDVLAAERWPIITGKTISEIYHIIEAKETPITVEPVEVEPQNPEPIIPEIPCDVVVEPEPEPEAVEPEDEDPANTDFGPGVTWDDDLGILIVDPFERYEKMLMGTTETEEKIVSVPTPEIPCDVASSEPEPPVEPEEINDPEYDDPLIKALDDIAREHTERENPAEYRHQILDNYWAEKEKENKEEIDAENKEDELQNLKHIMFDSDDETYAKWVHSMGCYTTAEQEILDEKERKRFEAWSKERDKLDEQIKNGTYEPSPLVKKFLESTRENLKKKGKICDNMEFKLGDESAVNVKYIPKVQKKDRSSTLVERCREEKRKMEQEKEERMRAKEANIDPKEKAILDVAHYYENRVRKTLNSFGFRALSKDYKNHKNWKQFTKIYELCQENNWDYRVYLDSQFWRVSNWTRKQKYPYVNQCYSEAAQKSYHNYVRVYKKTNSVSGKIKVKAVEEVPETVNQEMLRELAETYTMIDSVLKRNKSLPTRNNPPEATIAYELWGNWMRFSPYYLAAEVPDAEALLDSVSTLLDVPAWKATYDKARNILKSKTVLKKAKVYCAAFREHFNLPEPIRVCSDWWKQIGEKYDVVNC